MLVLTNLLELIRLYPVKILSYIKQITGLLFPVPLPGTVRGLRLGPNY